MAKKVLRAVGYCRTSGESQRDNTSIPQQRSQIEAAAKANGWKFIGHYVDECRSGAKTEGREEFQRMLRDSATSQFDVLVPFDATRLSRDGVDILSTAKALKDLFGIFTIDAKGQFDNRDHRNALKNFVHAGVSEWERLSIMERMIGGKIRRAKEDNAPTSGRCPWGRVYDRKSRSWSIDADKQAIIRDIAARYLNGESLRGLADEYRLDYSRLTVTLRDRCGDTWKLRYNVKEIGTQEEIVHLIPRLLDEKTIKAVKERLKANRTHQHGSSKGDYLLGGYIRCAGCGRLLTGTTLASGIRKYRHNPRASDCPLNPRPHVRADLIEPKIIRELFDFYGNPAAIERAVRAATPDYDKLQEKRKRLEGEIAKTEKGLHSILSLIADGEVTRQQAQPNLRKLNDRQSVLRDELEKVTSQMADVPEVEKWFVERDGDSVRVFNWEGDRELAIGNDFSSFLWLLDIKNKNGGRDRRALIESAFSTPLADGTPAGVYITPAGGNRFRPKRFSYEVRGRLYQRKQRATLLCPSDRTRSVPH